MSLFPSAFDTGAGPSAAIAMPGKKRKRASLRDDKNKDSQLRATQANLAKLMERVERGDVAEKAGTERLGDMGRKKGKGADRGDKGAKGRPNQQQQRREQQQPRQQQQGRQQQHQPKQQQGKQQPKQQQQPGKKDKNGKPQQPTSPKKTKHDLPKSPSATPNKKRKGDTPKETPRAEPNPNRPAPVELPEMHLAVPKKGNAEDGLTDMQRQMRAKLEGARFRWINEQLYSTPSTEAVAMMQKDPKIFADYHLTHRELTSAWPSPPLPHIIELLRPLPRGTVIADLGCGDAGLARALVPGGKVVLSYDLVGDSGAGAITGGAVTGDGWVVEADFLSHIPLPGRAGGGDNDDEENKPRKKKRDPNASEVVDVVVCCLSLMGTNWVAGVYEAVRVLKQGGTFHVAEVTSRFVSTSDFVDAITSFGLELESQDEPSTHFTLFRFTKKAATPRGPVRGEAGWDARVRRGEEILRACVYKKR